MRIVVSSRGAEDMLGLARLTLVASLRAEGHQVMGVDPRSHGDTASARTDAVVTALRGFGADLVVVVPSPGDLDLGRLRSATIELDVLTMAVHLGPTGGEAVTRLADVPDHVTDFDLVAVPHDHAYENFSAWGRHGLIELRPAVAPAVLDDAPAAAITTHAVVCVGDADPHNANVVRSLVEVGLDVGVVGRGWEHHADLRLRATVRCSVQERSARLAAASIAVELPPTLAQLSEADAAFEECLLTQGALDAAALGTPVVAIRRPGIDRHLTENDEVLVAERAADLPDLVRLVMSDPDELAAVGLAAQTRLRVDHRWDARWSELREWFGIDAPDAPPATAGVSVVVAVDESTDLEKLNETVVSISDADPSAEILLVGAGADATAGLDVDPPNLVAVDVPGAPIDLALSIGINRTYREWITVATPGTMWRPDRVGTATTVANSSGAIAVHSCDGPAPGYDRWDALRTDFGSTGLAPSSCLLRRDAAESGLWRSLLGDPRAIADLVASGPVVRIDEPLVSGCDAAPVLLPGPSIASFRPAVQRAVDADAAAASAFCDLAASFADRNRELARSLIELALDHVDLEDDPAGVELQSMLTGEARLDGARLSELASVLGHELVTILPDIADQVWDNTGGLFAVSQLVIDPAGLGPDEMEEAVVSYLRWFVAGEPVRLVVRTSEPRDEVIDWLAGIVRRADVDIASAGDIVIAGSVGVVGAEDLVIGADGREATDLRRVVDRWMADRRAALDATGNITTGAGTR